MNKMSDTPDNTLPEGQDAGDTSGRRRFLAGAGAACASAALISVLGPAVAKDGPSGSFPTADFDWEKHNWGYGIDANKCIGCLRCVDACKNENGVAKDANHFRTWVERYVYLEGAKRPLIDSQSHPDNIAVSAPNASRFDDRYKDAKVEKAFFVPKMCNHCENPSCVQVCPTGATFKTKDGAVLVDKEYCIGCQYCVQACPYGARYFNEIERRADKCTWCYHRISKGMNPACVEICPVGARVFGDMNDKNSPISKFLKDNRVLSLKPEMGNRPTCYYIGIDKEVS